MSKVLILGATGFIGKALIQALSGDNTIIAYGRRSQPGWNNGFIEYVPGNLSEEKRFAWLLEGVDVVIHLACSAVPSDDTSKIEDEIVDNIIPAVRLLEEMKNRRNIKLIYASSAGTVYGETGESVNSIISSTEPKCSYGIQKVVIENYIKFYGRRYGLNYSIIRMSNPYGIGQDPHKVQGLIPILLRHILNGQPVTVYGDGTNIRDYIYLPELIDGILKTVSYKGSQRVFNLGFGKYYSINEVINMVENITRKRFTERNELKERFCDIKKGIVDFKSSQTELGWHPHIELSEGIRLTYSAMQNSLHSGDITWVP